MWCSNTVGLVGNAFDLQAVGTSLDSRLSSYNDCHKRNLSLYHTSCEHLTYQLVNTIIKQLYGYLHQQVSKVYLAVLIANLVSAQCILLIVAMYLMVTEQ